jgi:hypothetical protein
MAAPRATQAELLSMLTETWWRPPAEAPGWTLTVDQQAAYVLALGWPGYVVTRSTLAACMTGVEPDAQRLAHFLSYAESRNWIMAGRLVVKINHADALHQYATKGQPFKLPLSAFMNIRQAIVALDAATQADGTLRALISRERDYLQSLDR